jgi:hypothetical protein
VSERKDKPWVFDIEADRPFGNRYSHPFDEAKIAPLPVDDIEAFKREYLTVVDHRAHRQELIEQAKVAKLTNGTEYGQFDFPPHWVGTTGDAEYLKDDVCCRRFFHVLPTGVSKAAAMELWHIDESHMMKDGDLAPEPGNRHERRRRARMARK